MPNKIFSPITKTDHTKLLKSINIDEVVILYKKLLNIDVSHYFKGFKKIDIYECLDTGYQFYYPLNLEGNSQFYEELAKKPWYYMPWKWEHDVAKDIFNKKDKILEIGSGYGDFISNLVKNGFNAIGLELNQNAPKLGKEKGIMIINQTIKDFSLKNKQQFDVVCSFQVLEHIANVKEFINSALAVLKPTGKLIISVPNNDSFIIKTNDLIVTNAPPHHMGLWNHNSLIKLQIYFNMQLESVFFEPLQDYHHGYGITFLQNCLEHTKEISKLQRLPYLNTIFRLNKSIQIRESIKYLSAYINGHTVMAIYSKNK